MYADGAIPWEEEPWQCPALIPPSSSTSHTKNNKKNNIENTKLQEPLEASLSSSSSLNTNEQQNVDEEADALELHEEEEAGKEENRGGGDDSHPSEGSPHPNNNNNNILPLNIPRLLVDAYLYVDAVVASEIELCLRVAMFAYDQTIGAIMQGGVWVAEEFAIEEEEKPEESESSASKQAQLSFSSSSPSKAGAAAVITARKKGAGGHQQQSTATEMTATTGRVSPRHISCYLMRFFNANDPDNYLMSWLLYYISTSTWELLLTLLLLPAAFGGFLTCSHELNYLVLSYMAPIAFFFSRCVGLDDFLFEPERRRCLLLWLDMQRNLNRGGQSASVPDGAAAATVGGMTTTVTIILILNKATSTTILLLMIIRIMMMMTIRR